LKAAGSTYGIVGYLLTLVAASAVTVVYFLAARLGLALLSTPSDVAVFWPAAGIAAGILILSGRRALLVVVIGVIAGTVAANVIGDRSVLTSLCKGFCNAGEAVLTAWLLERWFGRPFRFADLRRVAGFLAAAGLATAVSAVGGASTMTLLHTTAPYWEVWRAWFLSDGVGIVVVAPLMIGLGQMWRDAPSKKEWIESVGVLSLVVLASFYAVSHKTGSWLSFSPGGVVLPPLLWLTARCRPAFGLAGAFVASVSVILETTFGLGHFGDAALPLLERVRGAQMATVTVTVYALVLIALFAQRKDAEEGLRESKGLLAKERAMLARLHEVGSRLWLQRDLRQALDEILAGAIELLGADMGIIRILDPTRGVLKIEAHRGFKQEFIASFREVSAGGDFGRALQSGRLMVSADVEVDELFTPFRPLARLAGYRAVQLTPIMSRKGALLGSLATHFHAGRKPADQDLCLLDLYVRQAADIIERHKAEDALRESEERLRERNAQLALAGRAALVGVYTYDVNKGTMLVSEGYAAIHGLPEGTTETSYSDWRARVHPEDLGRAEGLRDQAFADRRKEDNAEYRIVLPTGELRWIERRGSISYGIDGCPERVIGVNIDVTERRRAEQYQRALNAELDHRVKNVLATVSAIIAQTRKAIDSPADFLAGLEHRIESLARTHELLSESQWRGVPLAEIIRRELAPYSVRNTDIGGPNLTLKAGAAEAVAMVFHELTTNAAKYGAFSNGTGRVSVCWRWLQNGSPDRLVIEWQEIDGPPVRAPSRSGYGTSIIRELIPFELGGAVELSLAPDGTRCRLEIPGEWANRTAEEIRVSGSTQAGSSN
jgi:two-component sensor histidine kinase/integral membrane sensor domain MASE1